MKNWEFDKQAQIQKLSDAVKNQFFNLFWYKELRYTMKKEWYISLAGNTEGPYDVYELRRHPEVTPDTLVWKEGFENWIPIREVEELSILFQDEEDIHEEEPKPIKLKTPGEDEVLTLQYEPFHWLAWLIILFLIIFYVMYKLEFY